MFERRKRQPDAAKAKFIVEDEKPHDQHKHHHHHPLKWICSPVVEEERIPVDHVLASKVAQEPISLFEDNEFDPSTIDTESSSETIVHPIFQRNKESTPLELFYDLFFVANLTAFTGEHEINDGINMRSYLGFFALLWFTWFNVSLYDLRLGRDSVFDRCCKAIQFGVMIGFAAVGANFEPNKPSTDQGTFSNNSFMAILLMISRITLCVQYIVCLILLRPYKAAYAPMILTIFTTFISGAAYMATLFAFPPFTEDAPKTYIAWYFICAVETAVTLVAAMRWRMLSFKKTHVVERMSLLTLIILGEGVIGLAEAVQMAIQSNITGNTDNITSTTKSFDGGLVAAVLILYFLYMLYFDWVPEDHFGTIREQIWAWFHFPLHMALVLAVEGSSQALKWRRIIQQTDELAKEFEAIDLWQHTIGPIYTESNIDPNAYLATLTTYLNSKNQTVESGEAYFSNQTNLLRALNQRVTENTAGGSVEEYLESIENLETIENAAHDTTALDVFIAIEHVFENAVGNVLEAFGAELPDSMGDGTDSGTNEMKKRSLELSSTVLFGRETSNTTAQQDMLQELAQNFHSVTKLFNFAFEYFFISAGLALICLGIIAMLSSKKKWHFWDWFRFSSYYFFGIALAVLALLVNTDFPQSAWVLPLVALVFFANVVTNHI